MNTKSIQFAGSNYRSINAINTDIDDELDFHIACRVDELLANGLNRPDAEAQAKAAFGSQDSIRKKCRQINYGSRIWLGRLAIVGLLISLLSIGCLTMELTSLRGQNAKLNSQLKNTQNLASAATIPPASGSTFQDEKKDLLGKVSDMEGNPVVGAKVLLIHKSWSNGFQMNSHATKTRADGSFKFRRLHEAGVKAEFKLTVLADGLAMAGRYIDNPDEEGMGSLDFNLEKATPKNVSFHEQWKTQGTGKSVPAFSDR